MKVSHSNSLTLSVIAFLLFVGLTVGARAQQFIYVPNFSSNNISAYTSDGTGALTPLPGSPFLADGSPGRIAVTSSGRFAYVGSTAGPISAYAINAATGTLTPVPGSPFPGPNGFPGLTMALTPSDQFLYAANLFGGVSAYSVNPITGVLTPVLGSPFATPGGQAASIAVSDNFAYVTSFTGPLWGYVINAITGALTPVPGSPYSVRSSFIAKVHPSGRFLYVGGSLAYAIDTTTGALTTVPGSPFPAGGVGARGMAFAPSGRFAYVANQTSNDISAYSVDLASGALAPIPGSPFAAGTTPVFVAVDPSGKFAYATNSASNDVSAYTIDATTGALTPLLSSPIPAGSDPVGLAVASFSPYAAAVLADHPVAYYRLGELPSNTIAADASGSGHNGFYEGNSILGVAGLIQDFNPAVNFGTTGDVHIADAPDLNFVNVPFTIEAWVSGIPSGGNRRIFDKAAAGAGLGYGLDISDTDIRLFGTPTELDSLASFSVTSAYHVVAVSNGTGAGSIYVNGGLLASGPFNASTPYTGDAHIAVANDGTAHFDGTIDEVAVYNYALPPDRVLAHYRAGLGNPSTLASLSLNPTMVNGGQASTGTITLLNPAPAGGAAVALASSNIAIASVPTSITIPAGTNTGTFTVSTSTVTSDVVVNLSATYGGDAKSAGLTVKAPLAPNLTVVPSPIAFSGVPITTSSRQTITITSTGPSSLTVNSIGIVGNFFTLANLPSLPLVLAPSATVSFDVIFAPLSATPSAGTLMIVSNAASSPTLVTVTGSVVDGPGGGAVEYVNAGTRFDANLGILPQATGWTYSGDGANPSPFISGGLLHEDTTAGGQYWTKVDSSIDLSQTAVFEARLRIISSNYIPNVGTGTREGYYFGIVDASGKSYSIGLADSGFNINSISVPNQPLTPFAIAGGFHTYRFEITNGLASFLIDGSVVATNLTPVSAAASYNLTFGGASGGSLSNSDLEYFCYGTSLSACTFNQTSDLPPGSTRTLKARVRDATGNTVIGFIGNITFSAQAGPGAVTGLPQSVPVIAGVATASPLTGASPGNLTVRASSTGLASADISFNVSPVGPPATLSLFSGNDQIAAVGQALPSPLVVRVTDVNSNPVSGTAVTFTVTVGGGTLTGGASQLAVNTDTQGLASVTLNLGPAAGPNAITATSPGLIGSPVTFTATAKPLFEIAVAPSALGFGAVPITTSSKQTITITSTGQSSLTISAIGLAGNFFMLGNLPSLPLVLAPSSTASFDIIFAPLGTILSSGTVMITSNAASSPTLVTVTGVGVPPPLPPAVFITLATDQTVYHRGQPVQISGLLSGSGGAGISNIPVNLQVAVNGTIRNFTAYTDALGTYRTVFQPASNDGGAFTVTTVGSSGGATQTATTSFRILGLLLNPTSISQDLLTGAAAVLPFDIQNLGEAPLTNLTYSVTVTPAGAVTVTLPPGQTSLTPGSTITIPVTLTVPAGNPPPGPVSVVVKASGTDPASGLVETGSATIVATLRTPVSIPVLAPSTLNVGVNPGKSLTRTFTVLNNGYVSMNSANVALGSGGPDWVALGNGSLGSINPGESAQFQIVISPPASVAVGNYAVPVIISGGSTPLQGVLNISVTQASMGSASFVVSDDIGARVSGATITLYGKTNGKTFQAVTDNTGQVAISGVDAGDYSYVVVADTHAPQSGSVTVTAGAASPVNVILSYDVVTLTFTVTPTTIVDQYNVTLNITYSTTLPKPALQVVPYSLDFSFFPEDVANGRYSCSLSVTNSHPTAGVRNLAVDATQLDAGQPVGQRLRVFFANGAQVYQVGDLAAKGTVNVPCYAVLDSASVPSHSVGNISVQANYDFTLDGQLLQGTTITKVPVSYTRPSDLTYSPISFIYDKKTDPANPVLKYDGDGFVYSVKSNRTPSFTLQKPTGVPFNGHNLVAITENQGGTSTTDVVNVNQSSAFWHGNFSSLKQSLVGNGDTTTYDISSLDCPTAPACDQGGLTLSQALASQVAINPDQVLNNPSYLAFEGQWADLAFLSPYLIPVKITTITPNSITVPRPPQTLGIGCLDLNDPQCKDQLPLPDPTPLPAQGGQIQIGIDQTIRLERQAFNATLGIGARTVLNNTVASIQVLDANGNDASGNFFVLVTSDPLGATHGATVSGQTAVSWQLIPNAGAGGTSGVQYQVKATLSFTVAGVAKSASTQAVTITVLPGPRLTVAYTAPFLVMPGKDIKVRVTVKNVGFGVAQNLSIQSMQPRVVATLPTDPTLDNPGPVVGFSISGSSNTADGSGFQAGNLTVNFGNVAPGATVSGYWTLSVTQKGYFVDISSTFSHTDYLGVALDPLILPSTTTLVPAVAGTVATDTGQDIPGLTVNLNQSGSLVNSDQTDSSGNYYIQDIFAGQYVEEVRDLSGALLASKNITVLGNQATDFINFTIANYNPTQALVCVNSNLPGSLSAADGVPFTTPHCFQWSVGSTHTLNAPSTVSGTTSQTLTGWSDGETASTRTVIVGTFGDTVSSQFRPTTEVDQYKRTQITSDQFDHKWPSTNNKGDLVWSQKDNAGLWQVFMQGPSLSAIRCQSVVNGICEVTKDTRNHERPVISDNGTIAWFQDGTGGGLGYAIERLDPGSMTPSAVEFSSRNINCNPVTGICSNPQERVAGKTFGISDAGQTVSFFLFYQYGYEVDRPFDVSGVGKLPPGSSTPGNFSGFESPDINNQSDLVYSTAFVPGVTSNTRYVYLATATQPFAQTLIDQGQYPHVSDRPITGTNPEIVYIQNGIDVTHWPGGDPSKWVALGSWADIVGTGSTATIVYECRVGGVSQICTAKPSPSVRLAITSTDPQSAPVATTLPNPLVVTVTDLQGKPLPGVGISFSITQEPAGANGAVINPTATQTAQDGTASAQFTLGNAAGQYQVTASCSTQNCTPNSVVFTGSALLGINVATNLSAATFTITGPATYTGSGTSFIQANAPPGTYTITYGPVAGYKTPPSETQTLSVNGSILFVGTYAAGLNAPTNVHVRQVGNNGTQIQLTWDYGSDTIDGFTIERKTPSGAWAAISGQQPTPGDRSYADTVSPFNTYSYRLRAHRATDESVNSNEATCFQILLYTEVNNTQMAASFQPDPIDLTKVAIAFGYDHFNWISYLTHAGATDILQDANGNFISHPPPPVLDPPAGGWTYRFLGAPVILAADNLPYYWNEVPGLAPGYSLGSNTLLTSLIFRDMPSTGPLEQKEFVTALVGVKDAIGTSANGSTVLATFTWSSNLNSLWGGITDYSRVYNLEPPVTVGTGSIFNTRVIDIDDLPVEVRTALIEAGAQGVSTAPKIDKDAPTTAAFLSGPQGINGWYTGPVTVSFIATDIDGPSDIVSTSYNIDGGPTVKYTARFAISNDGIHTVQFFSVDQAGNSELPKTITVQLDQTPPSITGLRTPAANVNGWNNSAVTVRFQCADSLSGLAVGSPPAPTALSAEGAGQSVAGACQDSAGNSSTATVSGINIDMTPPTLTFGPQTPPSNAAGWNDSNVSLSFVASDALSGVSSTLPPSPLVILKEGSAVIASVIVTDLAGNSATFTSPAVKIDKTPPTITGNRSPAANANGWNNSNVTVSFNCSDLLSGLAIGRPPTPTVLASEAAGQSVTGACADAAGNSASATVGNIKIDKTPPILTVTSNPPPNINGWNNSNVTVSFAAVDALSGVGVVSAPLTVTTEGARQRVIGSATDLAGNFTSGSVSVSLDKTPPEVFNQFDPATKDIVLFGRDSLSGVAPGPIQPVSVVSLGRSRDDDGDDIGCPDGNDVRQELRTYRVLDRAGNSIVLVEKVKGRGQLLRAKFVSIQYGQARAIVLPKNRESFDWDVTRDGKLKELEQEFRIAPNWDGSRVEADFDARTNQTVIVKEVPRPKTKLVKPGLELLRMATAAGKLSVEF